jgi:hypothetical protein
MRHALIICIKNLIIAYQFLLNNEKDIRHYISNMDIINLLERVRQRQPKILIGAA